MFYLHNLHSVNFFFIKMSSDKACAPPQWRREEICSIIVVWVVFFIFIYLGIFKHLFMVIYRAITTRNLVQRPLLDEPNSNPSDPSLQLQSRGLEFSIVNILPISQYKRNEGEHKPMNADCAICLGEFEEGEWLKHLPNCSHSFHACCIDTWFQSHSNCPLCRSYVHHDHPANTDHMSTSEDFSHSL